MENLILIGVGLLFALLESISIHLVPFESLVPNMVLPLIIYMGLLSFNPARGAAIAFVIGYFVDALQPGSPVGLNIFVFVCLFLISRMLSARLLLAGSFFHVLLALLASLISSLTIVGVRFIFVRHVGEAGPLVFVLVTRAATTAIAAPLVFSMARRIHAKRGQRREERLLR